MKITGFLPESFQDCDEGLSSVVFIGQCNYRCPACHARKIVFGEQRYRYEDVLRQIERKKRKVVDDLWVVVTGGEPTIRFGLKPFLQDLRKLGVKIKLDTNGSNHVKLEELREEGLVDHVAMDFKGPSLLYSRLTGMEYIDRRDSALLKGLGAVTFFPSYEIRTTVVPVLDDGRLRWFTEQEARDMAKHIASYSHDGEYTRYFLQPFVSRDEDEMMDARFSKQQLPFEMQQTPEDVMQMVYKTVKKHLPGVKIR